jgi:hypothetical protein
MCFCHFHILKNEATIWLFDSDIFAEALDVQFVVQNSEHWQDTIAFVEEIKNG